jgi:hypothetical protein
MSNVTTIGHNNPDAALNSLIKAAQKFGADARKGEAALPELAIKTAEIAAERSINVAIKKGGADDLERVYNSYLQSRSGSKDPVTSPKAQISKLRSIAKVAYRMEDAGLKVIQDAKALHEEWAQDADKSKVMVSGSKYDFLVNVARAQLAEVSDDDPLNCEIEPLSMDQLRDMLTKKETEDKTPAEKVKKLYEATQKLIDGRKATAANEAVPAIENENLELAADYLKAAWFDLDPEARAAAEAADEAAASAENNLAALVATLGTKGVRELLKRV